MYGEASNGVVKLSDLNYNLEKSKFPTLYDTSRNPKHFSFSSKIINVWYAFTQWVKRMNLRFFADHS
jgi:hypothetical protein